MDEFYPLGHDNPFHPGKTKPSISIMAETTTSVAGKTKENAKHLAAIGSVAGAGYHGLLSNTDIALLADHYFETQGTDPFHAITGLSLREPIHPKVRIKRRTILWLIKFSPFLAVGLVSLYEAATAALAVYDRLHTFDPKVPNPDEVTKHDLIEMKQNFAKQLKLLREQEPTSAAQVETDMKSKGGLQEMVNYITEHMPDWKMSALTLATIVALAKLFMVLRARWNATHQEMTMAALRHSAATAMCRQFGLLCDEKDGIPALHQHPAKKRTRKAQYGGGRSSRSNRSSPRSSMSSPRQRPNLNDIEEIEPKAWGDSVYFETGVGKDIVEIFHQHKGPAVVIFFLDPTKASTWPPGRVFNPPDEVVKKLVLASKRKNILIYKINLYRVGVLEDQGYNGTRYFAYDLLGRSTDRKVPAFYLYKDSSKIPEAYQGANYKPPLTVYERDPNTDKKVSAWIGSLK